MDGSYVITGITVQKLKEKGVEYLYTYIVCTCKKMDDKCNETNAMCV